MSDRVLVMREGRIVAEFARADATRSAVGAAMMGDRAGQGQGGVSAIALPRSPARGSWLRRIASQEAMLAVAIIGARHRGRPRQSALLSPTNLADILLGNAYVAVAADRHVDGDRLRQHRHFRRRADRRAGDVSGSLAVAGYPIVVAWVAPLALGVAVMALQGAVVAYLGIPAIVVTLGMLSILKGGLISVTGGKWITDLPEASISPTSNCSACCRCRWSSWWSRRCWRRRGCAFGRAAGRSTRPAAMPRRRGFAACRRAA